MKVMELSPIRTHQSKKVPKPLGLSSFEIPQVLDLEIGSGVGAFALDYAQKNPHRTLVALERTKNRFLKMKQRIESIGGLDNLFSFRCDGEVWVQFQLKRNSLDRLFFWYPNPYLKKSQWNKRFHNQSSTQVLIDAFKSDGELYLATNIEEYALQAIERYEKTWGLTLIENSLRTEDPRTHFEKKYIERGEKCFNLVFKKIIQQ